MCLNFADHPTFVDDGDERDQMVVIHEDGEVSSWDWLRESWKWVSSGFGRLRLPPRVFEVSKPRQLQQVLVTPNKRIYWIESVIEDEEALKGLKDDPKCRSFGLFSCEYRAVVSPVLRGNDPKSSGQQLEISTSATLAAYPQSVRGMWQAPQNGLWLHFASSTRRPDVQLGFFSPITGKLTMWKAPKASFTFIHHPTTLEMLILDQAQGFVSLLSPTPSSGLQCRSLSRIASNSQLNIASLFAHQHSLLVTSNRGWELFDLRSGTLIASYQWPSQFHPRIWSYLSPNDSTPGFWSTEGAWRLKHMPVAQYTNILASAAPSHVASDFGDPSIDTAVSVLQIDFDSSQHPITPQMSAAMASRDWSLNRSEAKYLLDILMNYSSLDAPTMNDTCTFVMACDRLVPHLQSPILLISILEESKMSSYACKITRKFIDTCMARHDAGISVVSQNEVDLRAFQLFTTFNTDTIHLLRKFVELAAGDDSLAPALDSEVVSEDGDAQVRSQLLAMPSSDCGKINLSQCYIYLNHCPEVFLVKLIEFSGFTMELLKTASAHIWPFTTEESHYEAAFLPPKSVHPMPNINPILLREEERPTHPDLLLVLCSLIYRFEPQWILPILDTLVQREGFTEGRSLLPRRALAAIPPFEPRFAYSKTSSLSSCSDEAAERGREDLRLIGRIGLLERSHRHASGLHLLLQLYHIAHDERYWKMILQSIDSKGEARSLMDMSGSDASYAQKTRMELITAALMHCLDPVNRLASPRYFKDLFERVPKNLTSMDLTTSLRQEFARIQPRQHVSVLVTDENSQMSVETLRSQIFKVGVS